MASYREQNPTDRFEKRRLFRFPVQLPVELGHNQEDMSSICTNLSWQGMSVETAQVLTVGERLAVSVLIAPKEEPLRMLGQVVWQRDLGGLDPQNQTIRELGIRFLRPLPSPMRFVDEQQFEFESELQEEPEVPDVIPFRRY